MLISKTVCAIHDRILKTQHAEKISGSDLTKVQVYFLPHYAVVKDTSVAIIIVVFDAIAKTKTYLSLINLLMVGLTINNYITKLLIRYTHKYVFICHRDVYKTQKF